MKILSQGWFTIEMNFDKELLTIYCRTQKDTKP